MVIKIISGGQTGADRAALDFAIKHNILHGGWVPKGRKAEDGSIPEKYLLLEMQVGKYSRRTEKNVLNSDGTLIISNGDLTGGSARTRSYADKFNKPCLHIDMEKFPVRDFSTTAGEWIKSNDIEILNIAGPKASKDRKIYQTTMDILEMILSSERGIFHVQE
jgi:hypothetical protein